MSLSSLKAMYIFTARMEWMLTIRGLWHITKRLEGAEVLKRYAMW
jgi:hypothetical protein